MSTSLVDTRGLARKLKDVRAALNRADARAQRDAAKQTRTMASKMVRQRLNLKKSEADKGLTARALGRNAWEFRAKYRRTPAHRFTGYRPNGRTKGGRARYLRVRFIRGQPALTFRRAFTIDSGGTQIALTRTGQARYPIVGVTGPSAHSALVNRLRELRRHGKAAYARRSSYHKDRELRRVMR